jgi:membrane protease YdiL (CAAX protease family)
VLDSDPTSIPALEPEPLHAEHPARPGPIAWIFWVLFFTVTFLFDSAPYLTKQQAIEPGLLDDPKMIVYSIVGIWVSLPIVLILAWRSGLTTRDMGFVKLPAEKLVLWSAGVFAGLALTGLVPSMIWGEKLSVVEPITRPPQGIAHWMLWIGLAASAGLIEEITMRGYGVGFLLRAGANRWGAAIGMALYFGLLHVYEGAAAVPVIATWGFLFAFSYLETGSILPGVIAHSLVDAIAPLLVRPS